MKNHCVSWVVFICILFGFNSCQNNPEDVIKLIPIKSGDKWGYIDRKGNYVINSQFEDAFNFSDGLALFKNGEGKFGFVGACGGDVGLEKGIEASPVGKIGKGIQQGQSFCPLTFKGIKKQAEQAAH